MPNLQTHPTSIREQRFRIVIVLSWLLAIFGAFLWLSAYASTPGPIGNVQNLWPDGATCELQLNGPTLLMFAHPRCPCTRASLRELALIIARRPRFQKINVIFYRPLNAASDWLESDIVRQAQDMCGVQVSWDPDGRLSELFGAQTSGHVMVYDAPGNLKFSGGITALRGHEGSNCGRDAVIALGCGKQGVDNTTPIFGCPLRTPDGSRNDDDWNSE